MLPPPSPQSPRKYHPPYHPLPIPHPFLVKPHYITTCCCLATLPPNYLFAFSAPIHVFSGCAYGEKKNEKSVKLSPIFPTALSQISPLFRLLPFFFHPFFAHFSSSTHSDFLLFLSSPFYSLSKKLIILVLFPSTPSLTYHSTFSGYSYTHHRS